MTHPDPPPKLTWESSQDNLIKDFYRPILKDAILYQRKAGYFSSTSFIGITNEIIELIERNGRIQLITSPNISARDKSIWTESVENREKILEETLLEELKGDPDDTKLNFWKIMAYMIANEIDGKPQLEIKIAIPDPESGIFHEKMGIIHYDDGEKICYVGSNNETYPAWSGQNIERFKAFHSWQGERDRTAIEDDQESFDRFWKGIEPNVKVFSLPEAVKQELLKIRPKSQIEFQESLTKAYEAIGNQEGISEETEIIDKLEEKGLRPYQKKAISKWVQNDYRGIFAMATGTGKTVTAYGCINELNKLEKRNVTVIACPYTHLVEQWKEANSDYNSYVSQEDQVNLNNKKTRTIVCYGEKKWRPEIQTAIGEFNEEYFSGGYPVDNLIIFVTHATLNSDDFKNYILEIKNAKKFLIVDEVHEIGSELNRNSLLEEYDFRLGLSATPIRHYDEEGTAVLMNYFNNVVYELDLKEAIDEKFLCEYEYHPFYVQLTPSEMDVYDDLTRQIAAKLGKKNRKKSDDDEGNPEIRRADLVAAAENKLEKLEKIIDGMKEEQFSGEGRGIKQSLIYCTSQPSPNLPPGSPTQLENVQKFLSDKHVSQKSITFKDPTKDRAEIIDNLAIGHYDCITAVKCLDQGVDIPSVEKAIIMASSGNPKQYIQRRGRVLRQSTKTGKTKAVIYDILVQPPLFSDDPIISLRERKLVAKELLRHKEFAKIAINSEDAIDIIRPQAELYKLDLEKLDDDYIRDLEDPRY